MPPRIQSHRVSNSLLPFLSSSSSTSSSTLSASASCLSRYDFSTTSVSQTRHRETMFNWLNNEGSVFKYHVPGETNYVTRLQKGNDASQSSSPDVGVENKKPFPGNQDFVSESILSEELRMEIYKRVVEQKKSIRVVSVELRVDMRRVGAVIRLVELEKRWKQLGKNLALPYARAIHEMVPTTPLATDGNQPSHESTNDLPIHRLTEPQIFYPVPESRPFTRVDAGRVFSGAPALVHKEAEKSRDHLAAVDDLVRRTRTFERIGKGANEQQVLQPADMRIPHPQLILVEKDRMDHPNEYRERVKRYNERLADQDASEGKRRAVAVARREATLKHVEPETSRFQFRIQDVVVSRTTTGRDGRGPNAPGRRYGVPSQECKKGQVKIPTEVIV
ncbi:hypothetical protein ASPZODRAFT_130285 [Penicilliopsis zonata CBS 506.65]|uniref:37S ribosomal protein S35, mitochondrial n=1 Tax=Penicilliopsis zonata CBS 506.65 TaxID=1073090 RepID=A0A1L9SM91_9EURO|nr:hypothetical protein ASPZODRAFT_130285 [Penicilliopsis zonata CBS 506.65]OJJ48308.1 hypothetical protein ASPZODRAFT_130285 [Penicilliopsis zonata CBS 506.65]